MHDSEVNYGKLASWQIYVLSFRTLGKHTWKLQLIHENVFLKKKDKEQKLPVIEVFLESANEDIFNENHSGT